LVESATRRAAAPRVFKILSVEPYKQAIVLRDPEGDSREVLVEDPALQHYLNDLKEGDTVQVTFTEAMAVSLEPR